MRRAADVIAGAQAILLDLGMSSSQLDESGRGFSFQVEEPLDMRLDPDRGDHRGDSPQPSARSRAGPHAPRVRRGAARAAYRPRHRATPAPHTTSDLVSAVKRAVPRRAWPRRLHVATRTFLAMRMAVNDELGALRAGAPGAARCSAVGGRLAVISFHSGEDRIVKQTFRSLAPAGTRSWNRRPSARGRRGAGQPPRPEREAARAGADSHDDATAPSSRTRSPPPSLPRPDRSSAPVLSSSAASAWWPCASSRCT